MHCRPTEPGFVGHLLAQEPTRHGRGHSATLRSMRAPLPVTLPYDSTWVLAFLGARALPGVERVTGAAWERATLLHGRPALVRVHAVGRGLAVESSRPLDSLARTRLERLFDTRTEIGAVHAALRRDPRLRRTMARHPGLRVPGAWDPFETAVRAVIGQQNLGRRRGDGGAPAGRGARHALSGAGGWPVARLSGSRGAGDARGSRTFRGCVSARRWSGPSPSRCCRVRSGSTAPGRSSAWRPRSGPFAASVRGPRRSSPCGRSGMPMRCPPPTWGYDARSAAADGWPRRREVERRAERWRPWRGYATLWLWSEGTR